MGQTDIRRLLIVGAPLGSMLRMRLPGNKWLEEKHKTKRKRRSWRKLHRKRCPFGTYALKFQGSRASMSLCLWPLTMAVRMPEM